MDLWLGRVDKALIFAFLAPHSPAHKLRFAQNSGRRLGIENASIFYSLELLQNVQGARSARQALPRF